MSKIRIAIYLRLSLADEDRGRGKLESDSIVNQRTLIHRFLDNHEELSMYPRIEFTDDGYSGTNKDRPAYQRMIEEIKAGRIQTVITKDFSRVHRDYLELGYLVEELLPSLGVRYISINDGYDSKDYAGTTGGLDVVMRAIVYDSYSKDLSLKVKTGKALSARKGRRNGIPPFGYGMDKNDTSRTIIDPVSSKVVRRIFDLAIEGKNAAEISKILNSEDTITPGRYYKIKYPDAKRFINLREDQKWNRDMVATLIKKPFYTGAAVSGRLLQTSPCSKQTRVQPKENWIIVPGMHEPIVSEEEFEKAQLIFSKANPHGFKKVEYPLRSLTFCALCGNHLKRESHGNIRFRCATGYGIEESECTGIKSPTEKELERIVYDAIMDYISLSDDFMARRKVFRAKAGSSGKGKSHDSEEDLNKKIDEVKYKKVNLYEQFIYGDITREEYDSRIADENAVINDLKERLRILKSEEDGLDEDMVYSEIEASCKAFRNEAALTSDMANAFIKKIIIGRDETVEIVWKFKDVFTSFSF